MPALSELLPLDPQLLVAALALVFAYTVFNLVGFGTALVASAPLAAIMPVARVIPLLALLDFIGAASRAWQARRSIARAALGRLLPGMLAGQLIGVYLLAQLPARWMALLLGAFIVIQGLRGLRPAAHANPQQPRAWMSALLGGMLGGLFGSGGFMYARYLERHLSSRDAFRATQAVLIALSTAWRILLCALGGLLDPPLFASALLLLPCLYAGQWLAGHIDLHLTREQLNRLLNVLLLIAGASLIARHLLA